MPFTESAPRIAYDVVGEAGSPVLLIMGFGMRGAMWQPQARALRERHRVATFDHRGLGRSEPVAGRLSMADMARDALRVADAAGFDSMHVAGVSMGGMIAQEVALAAPRRVRSLSLIATQPGGVSACIPTLAGLRLFAAANAASGKGRLRALEELLYPRAYLERCDRRALAQRMQDTVALLAPRETRLAQLRAVLFHDTRARLHAVRVPTLIVRPGLDVLIAPRQSDRLAKLLPHAEVLRFDDAGHGVVYQHADALNARLFAHFEAAEARSAHAA